MLVLRGGRIINPSADEGQDEILDIIIDEGQVVSIEPSQGASSKVTEAKVVDVSGCWVMPGCIDLRARIGEPGFEYKENLESGLRSAAAGGFTTVCALPDTNPVMDKPILIEALLAKASRVSGAKLIPWGALTRGIKGEELAEMALLKRAGAFGFTDADHCISDTGVMRRVMEYAATFDFLVSNHAEDPTLAEGAQMHEGDNSFRLGLRGSPVAAENMIVSRDVYLAELTGAKIHVPHLSSGESVEIVARAKERGQTITCSVSAAHLFFSDDDVESYDAQYKVSPPLRTPRDRDLLRHALVEGVIDCVVTDHRPQSPLEKDCEFERAEPGMHGFETAISMMYALVEKEMISANHMVELLSSNPAKILGEPDLGVLKKGSVADIVVFDPKKRWRVTKDTLMSKSKNTPWLGQELQGKVRMTLVDGEVRFDRSQIGMRDEKEAV